MILCEGACRSWSAMMESQTLFFSLALHIPINACALLTAPKTARVVGFVLDDVASQAAVAPSVPARA